MADAGDSVSDCLEALQTCPLLNLEQSPQLLRNSMLHKSYKETMALWKSIKDGTYQAQRPAADPGGVPTTAAAAGAAGPPSLQGPSADVAAAHLQEEPPPAESPAMSAAMDRPRVRGRYRSRQRQRWACQDDKENASAAADAATAAVPLKAAAEAAAAAPRGAGGSHATPLAAAAAGVAGGPAGSAGTPLMGFPANPSLGESWIRTTPLSGPLPEASATSTPSAAISAVSAAAATADATSRQALLRGGAAQQQLDDAEAATPLSVAPTPADAVGRAPQMHMQPETPEGVGAGVPGGGAPPRQALPPVTPAAGPAGASHPPGELPGDLMAQLSLVASGDTPGGVAGWLRGDSGSSFPEGSASTSWMQPTAGAAAGEGVIEGGGGIRAGRVPVGCSWFGDVGKWALCGKEAATPIPASLAHTPQEMREQHLQAEHGSEQEEGTEQQVQQQLQLGEEELHSLEEEEEEGASHTPAPPGAEAQQCMAEQQNHAWQPQQLQDEGEGGGEEVAVSAAGGFKGFWGAPHAPSSERYSSSSAVDTPGGVSQGSRSPQWDTPTLQGMGPPGLAALGCSSLRGAGGGLDSGWEQAAAAATTPDGPGVAAESPSLGGSTHPVQLESGSGGLVGAAANLEDGSQLQAPGSIAASASRMPPAAAQLPHDGQEMEARQLRMPLDTAASFDAASSSCSSSGEDWAAAERLQQQLKLSLATAGADVGAEGDADRHLVSPQSDLGDSMGSPGVLMRSPVPENSSWAGKWGPCGMSTPGLTPSTTSGAAGTTSLVAGGSSDAARGVEQAGQDWQTGGGSPGSISASRGSGSGARGGVEQQLQFSSSASSGGSSPVRQLHYQLHLSEEQEATPPPQTPAAAPAADVVAGGPAARGVGDGHSGRPDASSLMAAGTATCSNSALHHTRQHALDTQLQKEVGPASPSLEPGPGPMADLAAGSVAGRQGAVAAPASRPAGPLQGLLLDALDLEESLAVGPSLAGLLAVPSPRMPAVPARAGDMPLAGVGLGGDAAAEQDSPAEAACEEAVTSPGSVVGGDGAGSTPLRLLLEQSLECATPMPWQAPPADATPEGAAASSVGCAEAVWGGAGALQRMLGYTPGPAEAAEAVGVAASTAAAVDGPPTWGLVDVSDGATPAGVPPTPLAAAGDQLTRSSHKADAAPTSQEPAAGGAEAEAQQGQATGVQEGPQGRVSPSSSSISEGHVKRLVHSGPWAPPAAAAGDSGDDGGGGDPVVLEQHVQQEEGEEAQLQQQQSEGRQEPQQQQQQQQQEEEAAGAGTAPLHGEELEGLTLSLGQPAHSPQRWLAAGGPPTPLPFGTLASVQPTISAAAASPEQHQQPAATDEGAGPQEGGRLLPAAVFGGIQIGKGATEQQLRDLLEQQQQRRQQLLTSLLSSSISLSPGKALKSLTPRLLIRHQQRVAPRPTGAAAGAGGEHTPCALRNRQGASAAGGGSGVQGGSALTMSPGPSPCWSELSFQQGLAGRVYTPAGGVARAWGYLQRSLSLGDLSPCQPSSSLAAAEEEEAEGQTQIQTVGVGLSQQGSPAAAIASPAGGGAALPLSPVSPLAAALLGSGQLVRGMSASAVSGRRVSSNIAALDLSSSLELASNPLALAGLAEQLAAADADIMELQLMAAQAVRDATASRAERDGYAAVCKDMQHQLRLLQQQLNCSEAEGQRCLLAMADLVDLAAEMPDASPAGPGGDQLDQSLPFLDLAALVQAAAAPAPAAASTGEAASPPAGKAHASGHDVVAGTPASAAAEQLERLVEQVEAQQQALSQQNRHLEGLLAQQRDAAAAAATPGAAPLTLQLPGTPVSGLLLQQGEPGQMQGALLTQIITEQRCMQRQVAETQQQLRALMQQHAAGVLAEPPRVSVATLSTQTHPETPQQQVAHLEEVQEVKEELLQHQGVNAQLQQLLQANQQHAEELEQQVQSLQQQVAAADEAAAQVQQQLQEQLAAAEEQEEQQAEALQQAVQGVQRAHAGRQEAEATAASAQEQLQQVRAQVEDLQLQLFKAEELMTQDQQQPSSGSGEQELDVLELKADKADVEAELAAAQQQLEESRDTHQQLQQRLAGADQARERLAQQLLEQQGQAGRYQQELQELRAVHDDLSDQLTAQATDHLAAVRKQQDAAAALATALADKQRLQEALLSQQAQTDSLSKMYQLLSGQQQHKRGGKPATGAAASACPQGTSASSGPVEGVDEAAAGGGAAQLSAAATDRAAAAEEVAGLQQAGVVEETPRSRRLAASKGQLERRCHELLQENEQLRRSLSSMQQQLQEAAAVHQQEVEEQDEQLQELRAVCQHQVELLAQAQQQVVQTQEAHHRQAEQLAAAEQQLQQAVDEVQQAAAGRLSSMEEAARLQQAVLEKCQQQVLDLQAACSLQEANLAEAALQLQQAQHERREQQDRAAAAEAELDQLQTASEQQAQQLLAMEGEKQRQQEELAQQSALLAEAEARLQQLHEDVQQQTAQAAAAAAQQHATLVEEHQQQLQDQLQSTQQQLEGAHAEAEEREQQLAQAEHQAIDWEEHVAEQRGLLEEAREQLQRLLEQNQQLAQAMQEQQQDASAEEGHSAILLRQQQQRYQDLHQQHERTQQLLRAEQEQHATLAADHAQVQQQLNKKQQQVVELKAALQGLVEQQEQLQEAAEQASHQHNMATLKVAALAQQLEAQRVEAAQALAVHQADAAQQLLAQQQAAAKQLAQQKAEAAQQLSACQQRLALCQELLQALQQQQMLREKQQERQHQARQVEQGEAGAGGAMVESSMPQGQQGDLSVTDLQLLQQQLQHVTAEKQELAQELHQAKAVVEYLESCIRQLGRQNAELVAQLGATPPAAADAQAAELLPPTLQQSHHDHHHQQQQQQQKGVCADDASQEPGGKAALSPALLARVLAAATRVHEKNKALKQRLKQSGQP